MKKDDQNKCDQKDSKSKVLLKGKKVEVSGTIADDLNNSECNKQNPCHMEEKIRLNIRDDPQINAHQGKT